MDHLAGDTAAIEAAMKSPIGYECRKCKIVMSEKQTVMTHDKNGVRPACPQCGQRVHEIPKKVAA